MPTNKKRVNITVNDEIYTNIKRLAKNKKKSISTVSLLLIEKALDLEEDFQFSRISDSRISRKERRISHKKAWE